MPKKFVTESTDIVLQLASLLKANPDLRERLQQRLQDNAQANPDQLTNPVRTLSDMMQWLEHFLTAMPWESLQTREQSVFRKIDQATGYFYYLFGDLQFEPELADWIKKYNAIWGEFLNSSASWNNHYFELLQSDPLFELNGDKYESAAHWHSWNDFFSRRLNIGAHAAYMQENRAFGGAHAARMQQKTQLGFVAEGVQHPWLPIQDNSLTVKTSRIENITDLLGNSQYKQCFENGEFTHITLDIYNYHRFHSPIDGKVVDIQDIDGMLSAGGKIIWDNAERRYRYLQPDNIGFQMIEKRVAIIINVGACLVHDPLKEDNPTSCLLAIIPIGVAQVGSIRINDDVKIGSTIKQGQELGYFLCGGSDVVIMRNEI